MDVVTLVIGYVPSTDATGMKPKQIKEDTYMRELFAKYYLGDLHYAYHSDWKGKADSLDPLFIINLCGDYYAKEIQAYKNDAAIYNIYDAGQIFYRKAETEERTAKQHKVLKEIEDLVQKTRDEGEKGIESLRTFAKMSYNDMYEMIKQGILSKEKEVHDKTWELLFGEGDRHENIIWMRMQFLADTWDRADGKGREELMCIAMDHTVHDGMARKLETFTDLDGQQYHQYMFLNVHGQDMNYIRRIPFGKKGQDKYEYERMLTDYEIPANFLRVRVEGNQLLEEKKKYFRQESEKVAKVLEAWKANPTKTKLELGVVGPDEEPLQEWELEGLKDFLREHDPILLERLAF